MTRLARRNYTKVVRKNKKKGWRRISGGYWIPRNWFPKDFLEGCLFNILIDHSMRIEKTWPAKLFSLNIQWEKPNVGI